MWGTLYLIFLEGFFFKQCNNSLVYIKLIDFRLEKQGLLKDTVSLSSLKCAWVSSSQVPSIFEEETIEWDPSNTEDVECRADGSKDTNEWLKND